MSAGAKGMGEHAALMREIGSPNGFDPMPPSQHTFFLDIYQSETSRAIAWVWSKTIRPGRGRRRSAFARDERGALTLTHAAADLGLARSNASAAFARLEEQGRIRRDEKGRIWLRGDVPEPRRKYDEDEDGETKGEEESTVICTDNLNSRLSLFFQQLPEKEYQRCTSGYLELQRFCQRIEKDAIAAARATGRELQDRYLAAFGFEDEERRGRPPVKREDSAVQLSLLSLPELFVQITGDGHNGDSVQNSTENLYEIENASVQITPSLLSSSESSESSEAVTKRASGQAGRKDPRDCLPALAVLSSLFPNPFSPESLEKLNAELTAALGDYDADEYVEFVRERQKRGPITTGLVLEKLAADFAAKKRQDRRQLQDDMEHERREYSDEELREASQHAANADVRWWATEKLCELNSKSKRAAS
jgi:hypothetical protein